MTLSVPLKITKLHEPILVTPAEPTQSHIYFLSNLDHMIPPVHLHIAFFFEGSASTQGKDPAKVLRESLSKLLVHYYPLAGRLAVSSEGKLVVNANGQGVLFVEAEAQGKVSDLGGFIEPDVPGRFGQLVYQIPSEQNNILELPLLIVKVTKFECGGFIIGLSVNHCMLDGTAISELAYSWTEIARGMPLSRPPFLDRTILSARTPPHVKYAHHEFIPVEDVSELKNLELTNTEVVYRSFCFTRHHMQFLRNKITMENATLSKCTSFDAIAALVWKARTQAMDMPPHQKTKLLLIVDGRSRFQPPLPKGYLGNGIVLSCAITSARDMTEKPLSYAVKHVTDAKNRITDDYMRSAIDCFENVRLDGPPSLTATLVISTSAYLSFPHIDFGWGFPVEGGTVALPDKEVVFFLPNAKDRKSIIALAGLPAKVMEKFEQLLEWELMTSQKFIMSTL